MGQPSIGYFESIIRQHPSIGVHRTDRIIASAGYCAQKCSRISLPSNGAGFARCDMNGRQFIARVRKWARDRNQEVRFMASEGSGSHGTLYAGDRRTTVKDRKKEIGKGLLNKMLSDLGIDRDDF